MSQNDSLKNREQTTGYWFTGVTHDKDCIEDIKKVITSVKYYFYIIHSPDNPSGDSSQEEIDADSHFHMHFIVSFGGGRTIGQVARYFELPSNFIQKVRDIRNCQRYLVHKDSPQKRQYSLSDVVTNHPEKMEISLIDNSDFSITRLFSDLDSLRDGKIDIDDFIGLHKVQVQSMPFFQQLSLYAMLPAQAVR